MLLALCLIGFWVFENFYTPDTYSKDLDNNEKTVIPTVLLPSSTTGELVHHNHFTLSYREDYEQAEWVAYTLKKEHLTYDDRKRPYFIEDPKVRTKSADWRNYRGSGYDRGHLCPAGDRRFSENAYNETFYTSNISPQDAAFNAGIWNRLEQKIRFWAKTHGTLFVITGGVLEKGLPSIGEEDVSVPNYYYKIVCKKRGDNFEVIAFLFPHKESAAELTHFLVTVDKLEELTRIDFFADLSETLEYDLERKADPTGWKF